MPHPAEIFHATTVNVEGEGVFIIGPSGSGKSALALQMMALGALLVADDRTQITNDGTSLRASVPDAIAGQIEARGVGILNVPSAGPTRLSLVVDLGATTEARMPDAQTHELMGHRLPCLRRVEAAHFPAAILFYVRGNLGHRP